MSMVRRHPVVTFFLRPLAAIELMHAWANGVKCTVSGLLNLSRG
jgi:hypothetical protein